MVQTCQSERLQLGRDRLQFLGREVAKPKWSPSRRDAFLTLHRIAMAPGSARRLKDTNDYTDVSDSRRAVVAPPVIVGIRRAKQLPDSDPAIFTEFHEPPVNCRFPSRLYTAV